VGLVYSFAPFPHISDQRIMVVRCGRMQTRLTWILYMSGLLRNPLSETSTLLADKAAVINASVDFAMVGNVNQFMSDYRNAEALAKNKRV